MDVTKLLSVYIKNRKLYQVCDQQSSWMTFNGHSCSCQLVLCFLWVYLAVMKNYHISLICSATLRISIIIIITIISNNSCNSWLLSWTFQTALISEIYCFYFQFCCRTFSWTGHAYHTIGPSCLSSINKINITDEWEYQAQQHNASQSCQPRHALQRSLPSTSPVANVTQCYQFNFIQQNEPQPLSHSW